jgi:hypothetical protein
MSQGNGHDAVLLESRPTDERLGASGREVAERAWRQRVSGVPLGGELAEQAAGDRDRENHANGGGAAAAWASARRGQMLHDAGIRTFETLDHWRTP